MSKKITVNSLNSPIYKPQISKGKSEAEELKLLKEELGKNAIVEPMGDGNYAVGFTTKYKSSQTTEEYLKDIKSLTTLSSDIYEQMKTCDKLYRYEGKVGTGLDVLMEFAATEILIDGINEQQHEEAYTLLNYFNENLNKYNDNSTNGVDAFTQQGMKEYFVKGNAFPYKYWMSEQVNTLKNKSYKLPMSISFINPLNIEISEESLEFGQELIWFKPSTKLKEAVMAKDSNDLELKLIKDGIPKELIKDIVAKDKIPLDPKFVKHIKRKASDYDAWGIPYLTRIFESVASKRKLRRLDDATTEGMINYLTIFKIGSKEVDSPYHKVQASRLRAFARLISQPEASMVLTWAHDIEVLQAGPKSEVLSFDKKYDAVNQDMLEALGIPTVLIDGSGRGGQNVWVAILSLIERLDNPRLLWLKYLTDLYREILLQNNIKLKDNAQPEARFTQMNLKNEREIKNLLLSFWDRGLISIETTHVEGGYKHNTEIDRKQAELEINKLFVPPKLPFSGNTNSPEKGAPSDNTQTDKTTTKKNTVNMKEDKKTEVEQPGPAEGKRKSKVIEFKNDVGFDNSYLSVMKGIMTRVKEGLVSDINKEKAKALTPEKLSVAVIKIFHSFLEVSRVNLLDKYMENNAEASDVDLEFHNLISWNEKYLDEYREKFSRKLNNGVGSFLKSLTVDDDLLAIALIYIDGFFQEQNRILEMYAVEGGKKASLASYVYSAKKRSILGGYWRTQGDDKVCETCDARDGNWYTLDEIWNFLPAHNHCRCGVDETEENPILAGNHNNEPVQISKNAPSITL